MRIMRDLCAAVVAVIVVFGSADLIRAQSIANHKDVIVASRARFASLSGRLRAYCILNDAALRISPRVGLFAKTGSSSYGGRSSDILIYNTSETFDVLGDAENTAIPRWERTKPTGFGNGANWRAPVDPATIPECAAALPPVPPDPPIPPPTPIPDPSEITEQLARHKVLLAAHATAIAQLQQDVVDLKQQLAEMKARLDAVTCVDASTSRWLGHAHSYTLCRTP